jgi:hypothetical protein
MRQLFRFAKPCSTAARSRLNSRFASFSASVRRWEAEEIRIRFPFSSDSERKSRPWALCCPLRCECPENREGAAATPDQGSGS